MKESFWCVATILLVRADVPASGLTPAVAPRLRSSLRGRGSSDAQAAVPILAGALAGPLLNHSRHRSARQLRPATFDSGRAIAPGGCQRQRRTRQSARMLPARATSSSGAYTAVRARVPPQSRRVPPQFRARYRSSGALPQFLASATVAPALTPQRRPWPRPSWLPVPRQRLWALPQHRRIGGGDGREAQRQTGMEARQRQ